MSRWASGWPSSRLALRWVDGRARFEIEAPRQLARAVEAAVAAAFPGAELEPLEPSASATAASAARAPGRAARPTATSATATDFGALLVELLARLPRGATAAWRSRPAPAALQQDAAADGAGLRASCSSTRPSTGRARRPRRGRRRPPRGAAGPPSRPARPSRRAPPNRRRLRAWLFDAMGAVGALRAAGWRIEDAVGGRSGADAPRASRVSPSCGGLPEAGSRPRPVDVVRSRRLPPPRRSARARAPPDRARRRPTGRSSPRTSSRATSCCSGAPGRERAPSSSRLAADDLRAGRGLTFLDPHGDAVARLLDAVPAEQAHRVHLLELAEKDRPRGFNPIELDGADPELVAAQFVDTMRDLYFATLRARAHRQLQYLRYGADDPALTLPPGADGPWTLESLYRLFLDPPFRENSPRTDRPDPGRVLEAPVARDARGANDPSADAIITKLGAFLCYPSIRAIVSRPVSTIRPRRIMDAGDVLLVDLVARRGRQLPALREPPHRPLRRRRPRAPGVPPARRTPAHPVRRRGPELRHELAARRSPPRAASSGSALVMATQYLKGLGLELQSAIRANVATLLLLQPSPEDARPLADLVAPLTERDLVNLPRFRMAVRTELGGETSVLTADVLPEPPSLGSAGRASAAVSERDGRRAVRRVLRVTHVSRSATRSERASVTPYTTAG